MIILPTCREHSFFGVGILSFILIHVYQIPSVMASVHSGTEGTLSYRIARIIC